MLGRSPVKNALGHYLRRNGKVVDEPHRVTGYMAWLHILTTTPLPASPAARPQSGDKRKASARGIDEECLRTIDDECRVGVRIVRPAVRGKHGLPTTLDCSALPIDRADG